MRRRPPLRGIAAAVTLGVIVAAEWLHWDASRRMLGTAARHGSEAVLVLGFGNRGPRANLVNRYRVRAGIRSIDRTAMATLVLSGGTVEGSEPEAVIMARYAREELGFAGRIALEPESRSTWENVRNSIPLIEHADAIKIVSNSPHALVAREFLHRMRPDLADRLIRADEHRFGEIVPLKVAAAVRMLWYRLRTRDAR